MERPQNVMTVVEHVYHQPFGEQPVGVDSSFNRKLDSDEQMFVRKFRVTEEWTPINVGWVESAGMLMLSNDEGRSLQTLPSDEEKAAVAARVVELKYQDAPDDQAWTVLPGESMRAMPSQASLLMLRCRSESARVTLTLIPN